MKAILALFPAVFLFCGLVLAQEDYMGMATSSLQKGLSTLKQSVERLRVDNSQLTARGYAVRAQVAQLQAQLKQLEAKADVLNNAALPLQEKNPRKAEHIARLEKENYELEERIQKSEAAIKMAQQSVDAGYKENQRLLLQLKNIGNAPAPSGPSLEALADQRRAEEKIALKKMIRDSRLRQKQLEKSLSKFPPQAPAPASAAGVWDAGQLRQLETELKALEKNYVQMKDLMEKMSKKAQAVSKYTVAQQVEGRKLEGGIEDLKRQEVILKKELDGLRSQMVELDKRKSRLQILTKGLP